MRKIVALGAVAAVFVSSAAFAQAVVADGSFEQPSVGSGGYQYDPSASGTSFVNHSGVAANGSAFDFATAPDGNQVAFLQGNSGSGVAPASISLDVSGLTIGGTYAFSFLDALRPNLSSGDIVTYPVYPFTVSFDGIDLGSFSPTTSAWTALATNSFVAEASTGILTFTGAAPTETDQDVGIDNVQVVAGLTGAVPEPASWAMMLLGFGGIGFAVRRMRRPALAAVA